MTEPQIQPIKSLDELQQFDIVDVRGIIGDGLHVVAAIGDVPEHEIQAVLYPIHCPECPDSEIDYHRRVFTQSRLSEEVTLTKLNRQEYAGWRYAGINRLG